MDEATGKQSMVQLCACRMGLAAGMMWGSWLFMLGIVTMFTEEYGHNAVEAIGGLYLGFKPDSFGGALAGLGWGFFDGFVFVMIIVMLYNAMARCGSCCCSGRSPSASACCDTDSAEQDQQSD